MTSAMPSLSPEDRCSSALAPAIPIAGAGVSCGPMRRDDLLPGVIWVDHGLLSPDECAAWIARGEAVGYDAAPITTPFGFVMRPDIRNNTRVIIDDVAAAEGLWQAAKSRVPAVLDGAAAVGLNERFRLYRYDPGEYFAPHGDGCFERADGDRSRLTLIYYLNEGCEGGATRFFPRGRDPIEVTPTAGAALFFQHHVLHEGAPVTAGRKYVLRTDVMYRAPRPAAG
ncbi:MAG: WD-repeat protein [Myxococcaceae bacterium]|nr:WD-repeat protein [Myxococcaceae bacterium]